MAKLAQSFYALAFTDCVSVVRTEILFFFFGVYFRVKVFFLLLNEQ